MFNKFLCVLLTLCMSLILVSCNGRKAPNNKNDLELNNNELESPKFVTPPVKYIFPEFLLDTERITLLSRELYNSFDIGSANKDISSVYLGQIVSNFCFSEGKYYRYRYNSRFGIVDAEGKVKLEANYSEIKQIRSDLFLLSNFGTGEKSYAYVNSDKEFVITPKGEYDWIYLDNQLKISQTDQELANVDENVVGKIQYFIESPNGKVVYNKYFDVINEISFDIFDAQISGKCCYSAYVDEVNYILIFDEYYNLTVYEGSYGTVAVNFKNDSGSCYILSHEDFDQIYSLVSSFKYNKTTSNVNEEDNNVVITFGVDKEIQKVITIYYDGYCIVEKINENGEKAAEHFTVDQYGFIDVMDWINTVLSKEYIISEE